MIGKVGLDWTLFDFVWQSSITVWRCCVFLKCSIILFFARRRSNKSSESPRLSAVEVEQSGWKRLPDSKWASWEAHTSICTRATVLLHIDECAYPFHRCQRCHRCKRWHLPAISARSSSTCIGLSRHHRQDREYLPQETRTWSKCTPNRPWNCRTHHAYAQNYRHICDIPRMNLAGVWIMHHCGLGPNYAIDKKKEGDTLCIGRQRRKDKREDNIWEGNICCRVQVQSVTITQCTSYCSSTLCQWYSAVRCTTWMTAALGWCGKTA